MAEETGRELNEAIGHGVDAGLGLGQAVCGISSHEARSRRRASCRAARRARRCPSRCTSAIGTDIIHMHPAASGEAIGAGSLRDFRFFTSFVSQLAGGVYLNCGSAVLLPEVFLESRLARAQSRHLARWTDVGESGLRPSLSSRNQRRAASGRRRRARLLDHRPSRTADSAARRRAHRGLGRLSLAAATLPHSALHSQGRARQARPRGRPRPVVSLR